MLWSDKKFRFLVFACILVGIFEFLSFGGIHLPAYVAIPLFLGIIIAVGYETLYHGFQALIRLDFTKITLLMVIAAVGAFYLGKYEEAATVIVLYTLAEKLEDIGIAKSKSAFDALLARMPQEVIIKGVERAVPVDKVTIGQVMIVKPGEMIALDGVVSEGGSSVDESTITGEPIPKDKLMGDMVFAGTLNTHGYLEIKVTKLSKETALSKIQELTFQATKTKAKTQQFIEKFAKYYTPIIIVLAILLVIIPVLIFGQPFNLWFLEALTLIVIACPCALVISTPVSVYSAIGNASRRGVLIKGGRYLESLGETKAIALDKTRTLTVGKPHVTDVIPYGKQSKEDLLSCAAGIEKLSEHPLSLSIIEAAESDGLDLHEVENFQSIMGKGAKAECLVCESRHHCIGKLQFVLEEHDVPHDVVNQVEELQQQGKTVIVISTDQEVEGVIALADEIREESPAFIKNLQDHHIHTVMLTGDNETTAKVVGEELGIDEIHANLLPEEKSTKIEGLLKRYKSVAMVGDGINDAPALALSSVGISFGSLGSDTAIEAASVVLLNDNLSLIPKMVKLGKRTLNIIRFNTSCAVFVKLIFIALAFAGLSSLAMAIFADVGVTVLVILNSLRLFRDS
jgi:Zn2+/Cd2+-exporting ATPase